MSFLESLSNALTPGTKVDIADVPVGGGIVLTNGPYVVTQPTEGAFHAFRKNCTHQMRPVNEVTSEGISAAPRTAACSRCRTAIRCAVPLSAP